MIPFKIDLTGKTVVVTGGGGVLCSAFAKALGETGANIAVLDLRLEAAQKVADEIVAAGGKAIGLSANVLEKASLEAAKAEVDKAFGGCDILINGAGGNNPKGTTTKEYLFPEDLKGVDKDITTFFELDPNGIQFVFNLNFLGTLLPTQVFAKDMADREAPVILNVSSMNAFRPLTKIPAYSAAKAAISNFTQWLAVHFSKVGIRVNAIAPGFFVTDQNRALLFNEDGTPTARSKKILDHTPMNRFGDPSDLIGTLLWLCDNKASGFVNGVVVPVDGGFAAYSGV
ncbi:MAG: SDR family NAD(P)-dependent oxidoreductase [Ruminococcaceae bacterium]|nr:SDR family NAD(P)-dependent oxidoreductase [Oscillospiraceae bacterium]